MKVGFLNNQVDIRGTGNAVFNYAKYTRDILGHEVKLFTLAQGQHDPEAVDAFVKEFSWIENLSLVGLKDIDVLYHIKSGARDAFSSLIEFARTHDFFHGRYAVHAVFESDPHGDRYATISEWMGNRFGLDFVPHIVHLPYSTDTLREDIGIPSDATVFGRHGGFDSFDISWSWSAINRALKENSNLWFIFMNTQMPDISFNDPDRVVFVGATANPYRKRAFINTCDAMIHARSRGETFGIAVGEFAYCGKPVLTYADSPEKAHLEQLGWRAWKYGSEDSLFGLILQLDYLKKAGRLDSNYYYGYELFTPEIVMKKFEEVFLK